MDGVLENTLSASANAVVAFVPVCGFLAVMMWMDGYRLVRRRILGQALLAGAAAAGISYILNSLTVLISGVELADYVRYGAPLVEETLKSAYVVVLVRNARVGFAVDAAIVGFAVGTGFGVVENLYYFSTLGPRELYLWLLRGLGTAMMHGSTTAIFAMVYRTARTGTLRYVYALIPAAVLHAVYNHFLLGPLVNAVMILVGFPLLVRAAFARCKVQIERWLGTGLDRDAELLSSLDSGSLGDTPLGKYLESIRTFFPPDMRVDVICLIRLHAELSLRAKGILLMREAGFQPAPDPDIRAKLAEVRSLTRNVGKVGQWALGPILSQRHREVWQWGVME